MTLNAKSLQRKRAKKAAKRKQIQKGSSGIAGFFGFAREWAAASRAPVADVWVPAELFAKGMGTVWLSRSLPSGDYAMAGFLLDTFCLGVKNALYQIVDAQKYAELMAQIQHSPDAPLQREHPAYARKLVEGAEAYARDLGFEPHKDFKVARLLFGDIEASSCPASFNFGRDGKPLYIPGPDDTPSFQRRVIKQLEQRRGPDGHHFLSSMPEQDFDLD
jgi:hypothetical protein